jgi:hypothetical protein
MKSSKVEMSALVEPPVNTGDQQAATRFKPGQSGNLSGRPKGSRNRLAGEFVEVTCPRQIRPV